MNRVQRLLKKVLPSRVFWALRFIWIAKNDSFHNLRHFRNVIFLKIRHKIHAIRNGKRRAPVNKNVGLPVSWRSLKPVYAPPLKVFYNVPVVPATDVYGFPNRIANGGPIFPNWKLQSAYRYQIDGRAVDRRPVCPENVLDIEGEFLWGCYPRPHFGHLVSEHMGRVLILGSQRPDLPILFVSDPIYRPGGAHPSFWEISKYFGIPRANTKFVTEPIRVERLITIEQPEAAGNKRPAPGYLRLLDQNFKRNKIEPKQSKLLYVTRVGMLEKFRGGHLGEEYFQKMLLDVGVTVLDPAAVGIRTQLACFAGAKTIIFSEGSAIHSRQLLGKIDQEIIVLNRRPLRRLASGQMRARARKVTYLEATEDFFSPIEKSGRLRSDAAISFFDKQRLFELSDYLGLHFYSNWSESDYRLSCISDVNKWVSAMKETFTEHIDIDATMDGLKKFLSLRGINVLIAIFCWDLGQLLADQN
jgi:hypothetical protein